MKKGRQCIVATLVLLGAMSAATKAQATSETVVKGQVYGADGAGVGALVEVSPKESERPTNLCGGPSNRDGAFEFTCPRKGQPVTIKISAATYATVEFEAKLTEAELDLGDIQLDSNSLPDTGSALAAAAAVGFAALGAALALRAVRRRRRS